MKVVTILFSVLISCLSCNCQKATAKSEVVSNELNENMNQEKEIPTMIYEATTRGYFFKVKVENQKIYVSNDRNEEGFSITRDISKKDWAEISALVNKVDIKSVKDLKWPTEKRFYDGAAHASIIFVSNGTEYTSSGFDDGFPPVEIEKLVKKIVELGKKE